MIASGPICATAGILAAVWLARLLGRRPARAPIAVRARANKRDQIIAVRIW